MFWQKREREFLWSSSYFFIFFMEFTTESESWSSNTASLATLAEDLETSIDQVSTEKLQLLFSKVKWELTKAMYLGCGWILPSGQWIKWAPAWSMSEYRSNYIQIHLDRVSKSDNADNEIDSLFAKWRKYFNDEQYTHRWILPPSATNIHLSKEIDWNE